MRLPERRLHAVGHPLGRLAGHAPHNVEGMLPAAQRRGLEARLVLLDFSRLCVVQLIPQGRARSRAVVVMVLCGMLLLLMVVLVVFVSVQGMILVLHHAGG